MRTGKVQRTTCINIKTEDWQVNQINREVVPLAKNKRFAKEKQKKKHW